MLKILTELLYFLPFYLIFYFIILPVLHFTIAQFMMPKVFHCSKCALQHPWPVGKKCQYEGDSLFSDVEMAAPSTETVNNATVSQQILLQLQQLGDKMDLMDRRVQCTEAALE